VNVRFLTARFGSVQERPGVVRGALCI
jgi:hypothetical protein